MYELLLSDRNTWKHTTRFKVFVLDKNIWNHKIVRKKLLRNSLMKKCEYEHILNVIPKRLGIK